jgi:hypothetical protein
LAPAIIAQIARRNLDDAQSLLALWTPAAAVGQ